MRKKYLMAITLCLTISVISAIAVLRNHDAKQNNVKQKSTTTSSDVKSKNPSVANINDPNNTPSTSTSQQTSLNNNDYIATISSDICKSPNKFGNYPNNIINGGLLTAQDCWIYYCSDSSANNKTGIYKAMADGITGLRKISDNPAFCLNAVGSWLYYIQRNTESICKVEINGKNEQQVMTGPISNLLVIDDYMYFVSRNQESTIYKSKIDGSGQVAIAKGESFIVSDDRKWLYFFQAKDENSMPSLFKIKLDGSEMSKIADQVFYFLFTNENNVYFLQSANITKINDDSANSEDAYKHSKYIKLTPNGKKEIINAGPPVNISNGYLYYFFENGNNSLLANIYKIKDTPQTIQNKIKLGSKLIQNSSSLYCFNNKIYTYIQLNGKIAIYSIDDDGKNESINYIY